MGSKNNGYQLATVTNDDNHAHSSRVYFQTPPLQSPCPLSEERCQYNHMLKMPCLLVQSFRDIIEIQVQVGTDEITNIGVFMTSP